MSKVKLGIGFLITAMVGMGLGYWLTPVKTIKKTETKYVKVYQKNNDIVTIIEEKPDGTKKTTIIDKSTWEKGIKKDTATVEIKTYTKPNWTVVGNYSLDRYGKSDISGGVYRRVLGNISVGVIGSSRGTIGAGIAWQF